MVTANDVPNERFVDELEARGLKKDCLSGRLAVAMNANFLLLTLDISMDDLLHKLTFNVLG